MLAYINIQFISAVVACLVNFSIAALLFIKKGKSTLHLAFSLVCISMAVWSFGDMFTYFPGIRNPLKTYIIHTGLTMLTVFSLHFILVLLEKNSGFNRVLLRLYYVVGIIGLVVSWSPVSMHPSTPIVMAIIMFPVFFYEFWLVIDGIRSRTSAIDRNRLKYMAAAMGVMLIGGLSEYLPHFGIELYKVGLLTGMFYALIMAFAILNYNLLDIRIVAGRTLALMALAVVVGSVYLLVIVLCRHTPELLYSTLIIFSFIIFAVVSMIRQRIFNAFRKVFFRQRYRYHNVLRQFSEVMTSVLDIDELIENTAGKLREALKVKGLAIFIIDINGLEFSGAAGITPLQLPALIRELRQGKVVIKDEVEKKASAGDELSPGLSAEIRKSGYELFIPVGREESFKGFIALDAGIVNGVSYFEDQELIRNVAGQFSVAVSNAEMYMKMKHRDRLSALGTMAAGIAHEVKNPLSSIKSASQNIGEGLKDAEQKEYFDIIVEEVDRLDKIVSGMLLYARPGEHRLEEYDIPNAINAIIKIAGEKAAEGINFSSRYGDMNCRYMKQGHLKQVLLNLLINAASAMDSGGEVKISAGKNTVNGRDYMELAVKDSGKGIPEEYRDKIFQPFFTKSKGGSGLGLAVVSAIVDGYRGSIALDTGQGGTEIKIVIPV